MHKFDKAMDKQYLDPTELATLYHAIKSFKGDESDTLALWEEYVAAELYIPTFTVALVQVWYEIAVDETAPMEKRLRFAGLLLGKKGDFDELIRELRKDWEVSGNCALRYTNDHLVACTFPPIHLRKTLPFVGDVSLLPTSE